MAPFVPVLAALGPAAVEIQLGHELDRVAWVAAVVVVCAVLIRQVLLAIDLRRGSESDVELPRRLLVACRTPPRTLRAHARTKRDSDAFIVTLLTVTATIIALYDLLLLGTHVHG